jgi:GNAT superfamily N-acetyltransferase
MRHREVDAQDTVAIATLHAESWRTAYRGALRDEFLDGDILEDRIDVWKRRLSAPPANQLVVVAEAEGLIVGFACAYGGDDERWGTLLDNLHVRRELHRRGTGSRLLSEVAKWSRARYPAAGLYLWVVEDNHPARRFYESRGATDRGGDLWVPPGGGSVRRRRYVWTDFEPLLFEGGPHGHCKR